MAEKPTYRELEERVAELELLESKYKQMEETVRESYQTIFNSSIDTILIFNLDGFIVEANAQACKQYGYSHQEIIGLSGKDIVHPNYYTIFENIKSNVKKTGEFNAESVDMRSDGTSFNVEVKGTSFSYNGEPHYLITIRDITKRIKIEEALRESEEKYRVLFKAFPLGVTVSDPSGNILETNQMAEKLLEISQEEHEKRSLDAKEWTIIRPDGSSMPSEEYPSVIALKKHRIIENIEMGVVKNLGDITWLRVTAAPIPLEKYGVVVTYGDITEQRRFEVALLKSEEKFRIVFNNSIDAIYHLNLLTGTYDYLSPSCEKVYGYTQKEFIAQGLKGTVSLLHPDDLGRIKNHIDKLFSKTVENNISPTIEYRFKHKKLGYRWISDTRKVMYDHKGTAIAIVGNSRDITESKLIEESLKDRTEILNRLMANYPGVAYIIDKNGYYIFDEGKGLDYIGLKPNQAVEEKWNVFEVYKKDKDMIKAVNNALNDEVTYLTVFQHDHYWDLWFGPYSNEKGDIIGILGTAYNVTKSKQLEFQLQQSQKMESIGSLAGGIAHDFNNILFPIVGHTEMLLEDVPADSPFRAGLNQIYAGAMRASDLVKQILTFSRQETGEVKLIKIQHIIKEALKLVRSTIPTTIKIKQDIKTDCGVIKADPTQIHQIVMNLATNAYHAMEKTGGELNIRLNEIKLGETDLFNPDIKAGTYACLRISDTGKGMNKELIEKIFDPFFTTKEKGKGTGMGLSVVHGIVNSMGGDIKVYSELGKGTELKIYFPIEKSSFDKQSIKMHKTIQGGMERILLIDDEEAIITMEKLMLERLGYRVTSHTISFEALDAFRAAPEKFDLVITDMAMPNMPGDILAVELTKIRPDIPVLLCTGFSETISEEKAASLGIKGFLLKPIVKKDLSQKIREALDEKEI